MNRGGQREARRLGERNERIGGGRMLAHGLLALASFAATAAAIGARLPAPSSQGLHKRVELFREHKDEVDVLFLGSSNAMCSLIPSVFEDELARLGHELRAYTLGVPGVINFEADYLLECVLDCEPARMRWLIMELSEWKLSSRNELVSDRAIRWHTPRRTCKLLAVEWRRQDATLREKLATTRAHARMALARLANAGQLQHGLAERLGVRAVEEDVAVEAIARERGYMALEDGANPGALRAHEQFLESPEKYLRGLQAWGRKLQRAQASSAHNVAHLAERLALCEGMPAELVHVIYPSDEPAPELQALARDGLVPELWAFNRPDLYPSLYEREKRFDGRHMNRRGAEEFSRICAQRFARHLAELAN